MGFYLKTPVGALDYAVDWGTNYLDGQAVADSVWSVLPVEPGGVTVAAHVRGDQITQATLDGGVDGHVYRVENRVTLSDGRVDARTLTVRVDAR